MELATLVTLKLRFLGDFVLQSFLCAERLVSRGSGGVATGRNASRRKPNANAKNNPRSHRASKRDVAFSFSKIEELQCTSVISSNFGGRLKRRQADRRTPLIAADRRAAAPGAAAGPTGLTTICGKSPSCAASERVCVLSAAQRSSEIILNRCAAIVKLRWSAGTPTGRQANTSHRCR